MFSLSTGTFCQLGRERDAHGLIHWILTYPTDDPCECPRVIMGGFNMQTPSKLSHESVVLESSLRFNTIRFERYKLRCKGKVVQEINSCALQ